MKQLLLSFSLCLAAGAAGAATVSGTVTSAATCAVVSGQKVYLRDTVSLINVDSAVTNSSGMYSMNFPSGWTTPTNYLVAIPACGINTTNVGVYTGSNATINAIICGAAKTLNGTVMLGSTPNTGPAKVYLVKVQRNNPVAGDTTLTAVDSVTLTNSPNFSFKRACAPTDTFLIKAVLQTAHASYANWMPTYDSSLNWSTAQRYYSSAWGSGPHYLYMIPGSNPGGPGFIGGSVLVGANKGAAVGDPLTARLMMLVNNATGAPVAYTYSDASGKFSFPSVATGTYRLFGDAWGLYNMPLTVSVSSTNLTVNNIVFEENYGENTFKGRFKTSGVGTTSLLAGVNVYPNPATKTVSLMGISSVRGSKTALLRNVVGAVMTSKTFRDGQAVELSVEAFPAGTYILLLSTEAGTASFKVVK